MRTYTVCFFLVTLLATTLFGGGCGDGDTTHDGDADPDVDLWDVAFDRDETDLPDADPDDDRDENDVLTDTTDNAEEILVDVAEESPAEQSDETVDFVETADNDDPIPGFCTALDQCELWEVCDLSRGVCETRDIVPGTAIAVFGFHPPVAAPGDTLVIDGRRFFSSLLGTFQMSLTIGGVKVAGGMSISADENRILLTVPASVQGPVVVTGEGGVTAYGPYEFLQGTSGEIPCDGGSPAASGEPGATPVSSGPYAAGYVDIATAQTRIFYPADCGGVRRPPVKGTHPLALLLHGNGALHLNYEYMGALLATWGFVAAMPSCSMDDVTEKVVNDIMTAVDLVWNRDLGTTHPVLAGVTTTYEMVAMGHSRGSARMEGLVRFRSNVATALKAAVFLGPVDDGHKVPGMFMVFGATGDRQSEALTYNSAYNRQAAPKWKFVINGGNHSLFSDHKVWLGILSDDTPTIFRRQQHAVVCTFVVPLFQRAFGLDEPFADLLDNARSTDLYSAESVLQ